MSQLQPIDDNVKIGFVAIKETDSGYRGALLVTDRTGAPLEFRCTSAVNPTRMQRILYGKMLLPHIALRLVALPLYEAMSEKPMLWVARDEVFLRLRDLVSKPVVRVIEVPAAPSDKDWLGPFSLLPNEKYPEDLDVALAILRECEDALEPFERIEQALIADEERVAHPR